MAETILGLLFLLGLLLIIVLVVLNIIQDQRKQKVIRKKELFSKIFSQVILLPLLFFIVGPILSFNDRGGGIVIPTILFFAIILLFIYLYRKALINILGLIFFPSFFILLMFVVSPSVNVSHLYIKQRIILFNSDKVTLKKIRRFPKNLSMSEMLDSDSLLFEKYHVKKTQYVSGRLTRAHIEDVTNKKTIQLPFSWKDDPEIISTPHDGIVLITVKSDMYHVGAAMCSHGNNNLYRDFAVLADDGSFERIARFRRPGKFSKFGYFVKYLGWDKQGDFYFKIKNSVWKIEFNRVLSESV